MAPLFTGRRAGGRIILGGSGRPSVAARPRVVPAGESPIDPSTSPARRRPGSPWLRASAVRTILLVLAVVPVMPAAAQVIEPADGWVATVAPAAADLSPPERSTDGWVAADPTARWEGPWPTPGEEVVWYRRTVSVGWDGAGGVLLLPSRSGWLELYADGVRLGRVGSEAKPYPFPRYHTFDLPERLTADGEVTLALRHDPRPWLTRALDLRQGAVSTLTLGAAPDVAQRHALQVLVNRQDQLHVILFFVVFLVVGLYHLLLFRRGGEEREYLWFGVASVLVAVNVVAFSAWTPAFVGSYAVAYRVTDVTAHLATVVLISFLWVFLGRPMGRWLRAYQLSHLVLAALVAVVPFPWVVATSAPRSAWLLPILLWALWVLQDESARGNPDARPLAVGGGLLVLAELAELARIAGLVETPREVPAVGFALLLLSMAVALAGRFSRVRSQLDDLTGQLESRVAERTAELRRRAERAHAANASKTRLLSAMSHELRTPLNSVIGFTRIMLRKGGDQLSERDRGFVRRIHTSGRELLGLIDQILDMARIEEGRFTLHVEPGVSLAELVEGVVADVEPLLEGRRVELRSVVPASLRPVRTDPERLRQVLFGLTSNAVKHTHEGTVTLRIVAHGDVPMAVEVVDTGLRMPPDEGARFRPESASAGEEETGDDAGEGAAPEVERDADERPTSLEAVGLGLALARAVCDELGYAFQVAPGREAGSVVRVLLSPEAIEEPADPATVAGALRGAGAEGKRVVLVIDDDPDARVLMSELLGELGCTPVLASSGEEGMRLARRIRPDLVTLDLRMPGLDGWTVLKVFREDEELRDVPVVVVSVVAEEARGEVLGPVEMVGKPVDPDALARAVERQTGRTTRRTLVVDDDPDARALLGEPLAELGADVREAANGAEALAALEEFDADLVLLDLVMPGMDGFEFLERLRRDPARVNLPVIIVTSKELDRDEVRLLRQTSQGLVRKERRLDRAALRRRLALYLDPDG